MPHILTPIRGLSERACVGAEGCNFCSEGGVTCAYIQAGASQDAQPRQICFNATSAAARQAHPACPPSRWSFELHIGLFTSMYVVMSVNTSEATRNPDWELAASICEHIPAMLPGSGRSEALPLLGSVPAIMICINN